MWQANLRTRFTIALLLQNLRVFPLKHLPVGSYPLQTQLGVGIEALQSFDYGGGIAGGDEIAIYAVTHHLVRSTRRDDGGQPQGLETRDKGA